MNKKTVVLIPTLNPNELFIKYCKDLSKIKNIDIVVVNDGSKDDLKYIFDKLNNIKNCVVLTHPINLGKGSALKTGFKYFLSKYTKEDTNGIITADSDGQHDINDIIKISMELNNTSSIVLGVRDFNKENVPFRSRYGNKITTMLIKLLYGKKINDTQTGLRGLSFDYISDCLNISGERFEYEINMLIDAIKSKVEIKEVNIKTIYINNNNESHFNPIKDSFKIYKVIFKSYFNK